MAQNVTVAGATYSAVPSVNLPKQGGGTASFFDVSDTTAAASDVASGKYFYTAAGVRTAGTSSGGGGGGSVTQDEQGYIVLPDTGGGGSVTVTSLNVTSNGTYTAPTGKAYSPVTVNVGGGALAAEISGTIEVTTTSTTAAVVATLTHEHQTAWYDYGSYLLICVVSDTDLGRNNYFQYSMSVMMFPSSTTRTWSVGRDNSGTDYATGAAYGVYLSSWSEAYDDTTYKATYKFSARTQSTYAPTVDSEYAYKIYVVPMSDLM